MEMHLFGVSVLAKLDYPFHRCERTFGSNVSSSSAPFAELQGHTFSQRKGSIMTTVLQFNSTWYGPLEVPKYDAYCVDVKLSIFQT